MAGERFAEVDEQQMPEIRLSASAAIEYGRLNSRDQKKVNRALSMIERSPLYYPGHIVPLKPPLAGLYRCRVGEWRIIYGLDKTSKAALVAAILKKDESTYRG